MSSLLLLLLDDPVDGVSGQSLSLSLDELSLSLDELSLSLDELSLTLDKLYDGVAWLCVEVWNCVDGRGNCAVEWSLAAR